MVGKASFAEIAKCAFGENSFRYQNPPARAVAAGARQKGAERAKILEPQGGTNRNAELSAFPARGRKDSLIKKRLRLGNDLHF